MEQNIQTIIDLVTANENLSVEEKAILTGKLKETDKKITITEFKLDRTEKVKRTTAILLEETIEELENKRKAIEAQNKELEIEAALEKVRSSALAMKEPAGMLEVCRIIAGQLAVLDVKEIRNVQTAIFYEAKSVYVNYEFYVKHEKTLITEVDYSTHTVQSTFANQMMKGPNEFFTQDFTGKEVQDWYAYQKTTNVFLDSYLEHASSLSYYWYSLGPVALGMSTYQPLSEEQIILFQRFRNVFGLAYRRYLDIEQAEAQAREARIELALERVRARTMAMQNSDELPIAANLLFQQVQSLGLPAWSAGYCIWDEDKQGITLWMSSEGVMQKPFHAPLTKDPSFIRMREAYERNENFHLEEVGGEALVTHYQYMRTLPVVGEILDSIIAEGHPLPGFQIFHCAYFVQGFLLFITYEPVTAAHDIFKRFSKVFEQTYTRFLDLQKAEAQALEAIKRASVDRVRAEIASMRTTADLERITPLIWNELTTLAVPFIRCGVFIMDEDKQEVQTFLYTEGKTIASFSSTFSNSSLIVDVLPYWRRKAIYKTHWDEAAFLEQARTLVQQGAITSGEKYLTEHRPTDLYLHFLPFLQGMLYVGDAAELSDENLQLVQALADAFSTAYARYEDFNKLETAKIQVDNTLHELKETQRQLIQSEKMASLGELTAGIAHEIQNPLNFVNNFSDVNAELLEELEEALNLGNIEEAIALANDIRDNEQKINHHGKRADAIVKGMLQHSRSSTGQKEPADINKIADEYLRLSYHGLRAKDKMFNSVINTDFDAHLEKINIVAQDIGRVLLNLFNNAFYAVNEKKKQLENTYDPVILVSTRKESDFVFITVSDNGNGIQQKALDKIFQPFFTTKPTGQGTGLGLSLSYDIIKAHGGEIKVKTQEGKGTTFIIELPLT